MSRREILLSGNITKSIIKMALPLMGIAFIQMTYTLVDLIWLGRLSTEAVAAVGSCGFFVWAAQAITLITKTGMSVGLSHAYGRGDESEIKSVVVSGFQVTLSLWLVTTLIYLTFKESLYGYFKLEKVVESLALEYHTVISFGLIFTFLIPFFSSIFYSQGNSSTPFKVSLISLVFNIVADPIFIFGFGPIRPMGMKGAALATIMAQIIGVIIYIFIGIKYGEIYTKLNFFEKINKKFILQTLKLGIPVSIQSLFHSLIGIKLNQYIAIFGSVGVATYAIGSQIESISWMSAEGFATAFSSFFGQNYGAKNFDRLEEAKKVCLKLIISLGLFASAVMIFGSKHLFKLFTPNDLEVISEGGNYLMILGITATLLAMEIGVSGMLNGLGLTKYPAINGVVLNAARIPMAYFLMKPLAISGIWWTMSLSGAFKGIVILLIFIYIEKKTNGFRINMEKFQG
ncbi:MATE family efflux transporter [Anaerosphaera multitolerans]|uniref:Probable multidrug resistance protein NorM n=1 Tax=Anaerosphaera multitolerans TaxID=2487351 RepID=A0A437S6H1_9FIRM|nr:MATE family efflux transporter [Anaerosphaera multitolerans]RVU54605.1 MATE family efflux transporter [Anaerosphaera multitolerans]